MSAHGHCRHRPDLCSSGFTRTPDDVLDDPQLSPAERLVLIWLARYEFRLHGRYPGHDALAQDMRLSRSQTLALLAHLQELGWIDRQGGGPGQTCSITWPTASRRLPLDVQPTGPYRPAGRTPTVRPAGPLPSDRPDTPKDSARLKAREGFLNAGGDPDTWSRLLRRLQETP